MGLGRATSGVIEYLQTIGEEFRVYDDDPEKVKDLQSHLSDSLSGIDEVVVSPGIPSDHPIIKKAMMRRIPVIDEVEFTYRITNGQVVAVTGTNGKSTTIGLIGGILGQKRRVFIGGNLAPGRPYSAALLEPPYDLYLLEVSSFQLERIQTFRPMVAVLTNIGVDHLDRHRDEQEYIDAKLSIFSNQGETDHAILNRDDRITIENLDRVRARRHFFTLKGEAEAWVSNGRIVIGSEEILGVEEIPIPGEHNIANVLAAALAAWVLKATPEEIRKGILEFTGLRFRMERVGEKDGVVFINNSMCTNPQAALASLRSLDRPFIIIMGGKEKGLPDGEFLQYVAQNAHFAVLIGANRSRLEEELKRRGFDRLTSATTIEEAVKAAFAQAKKGMVIILNPGYASLDMFGDFIERGERFNDAVATV